jgi:hypothetical protein
MCLKVYKRRGKMDQNRGGAAVHVLRRRGPGTLSMAMVAHPYNCAEPIEVLGRAMTLVFATKMATVWSAASTRYGLLGLMYIVIGRTQTVPTRRCRTKTWYRSL